MLAQYPISQLYNYEALPQLLKSHKRNFHCITQKKNLEVNSLSNLGECKIDDNKLCTTNTSNTSNSNNTKGKPETWFQNKTANKNNSNLNKEKNDENKGDLKGKYFKIEKTANLEVQKKNRNKIKREIIIFAEVIKAD